MQTKLGRAIKLYIEWFFLRVSGDSSPDTCNKVVDSLDDVDSEVAKLEARIEAIESRVKKLEATCTNASHR